MACVPDASSSPLRLNPCLGPSTASVNAASLGRLAALYKSVPLLTYDEAIKLTLDEALAPITAAIDEVEALEHDHIRSFYWSLLERIASLAFKYHGRLELGQQAIQNSIDALECIDVEEIEDPQHRKMCEWQLARMREWMRDCITTRESDVSFELVRRNC